MIYGWTGKLLRIDLSEKTHKTESIEKYQEEFLGGKGVNAKLLWDEVTPDIKPFDPENRLIFGTGPLTGTLVPCSCKGTITTKSPVTERYGDSSIGGFWPAELKYAGYDHLLILGKSSFPSYIYIKNDSIEIRDASHLWGKDTLETTKILTSELGGLDIQILCIGEAGENLVATAAITGSLINSASRTGVGAVMGSKNLKAIAICGEGDILIAKPDKLKELYYDAISKSDFIKDIINQGELVEAMQMCTFKNGDEIIPKGFENVEEIKSIFTDFVNSYRRRLACFNCNLHCKSYIDIPGSISTLNCEAWGSISFRCLNDLDLNVTAELVAKCQKHGLDIFSVISSAAFLMDLYEKGVIDEKITDGIKMNWGNKEALIEFVDKIAKKEGCGKIFSEGITHAAEKIGNGAEKYLYHIKGMELGNYPLNNMALALPAAVSERGDFLRSISLTMAFVSIAPKGILPMIKYSLPDEISALIDEELDGDERITDIPKMINFFESTNTIADLLGVCRIPVYFYPFGILPLQTLSSFILYTTGKDISEKELFLYNEKVSTLIRAYNIREGLTREKDTIPNIYFEKPSEKTGKKIDQEILEDLKTQYYQIHNWDKYGFPQIERLNNLHMSYIADELKSLYPNS